MKKEKILFLVLNSIIVLGAIYALIMLHFQLGSLTWRYFTNLSNTLMAIISLLGIVFTCLKKEYKWFEKLYFVFTVCVTLTCLTVVFFLAPIEVTRGNSYFLLFRGNMFFFHFFSPLLAVLTYLLCFKNKSTLIDTFLPLIPIFIYAIVYLICVVTNTWPDFYSFTFGGKYALIPLVFLLMLGVSYLISFIESKIHNKIIDAGK